MNVNEDTTINYNNMFAKYPDVVTIQQLMQMLHIGKNKAYELIHNGTIQTVKIGKKYIIPKVSVIQFLSNKIKLIA
ncbi:MAG: helix-turn-helix domain-containing protein [Acutalibacteraceae bacterium]